MRIQVGRPRKEMLQLQQARIPTAAAEALLQRMLEKIAGLRAERDHMKAELPKPRKEYFGDDPNPPPSIKALAEVRQLAMREGWCFQHVQAISVAIDQYAEKALCNRSTSSTSHTASAVVSCKDRSVVKYPNAQSAGKFRLRSFALVSR